MQIFAARAVGEGSGRAVDNFTAAPRWPQLKLAQMTLYANIFKISLLLGHFTFFCCVYTPRPLCKLVQTNPLQPHSLPPPLLAAQLAAFALITQILSETTGATKHCI